MVKDWKELRALVVGCGSIGRRHARVLRQIGVKTLFACDPVPGQVEAAARKPVSTALPTASRQVWL